MKRKMLWAFVHAVKWYYIIACAASVALVIAGIVQSEIWMIAVGIAVATLCVVLFFVFAPIYFQDFENTNEQH